MPRYWVLSIWYCDVCEDQVFEQVPFHFRFLGSRQINALIYIYVYIYIYILFVVLVLCPGRQYLGLVQGVVVNAVGQIGYVHISVLMAVLSLQMFVLIPGGFE